MNYNKFSGYYKSNNGINDVKFFLYMPLKQSPKAILQIFHGMCEYVERYEEFIDFLCGEGYAVCGNDHIGHGGSVSSDDELGFFAEKNGWRCLVKDSIFLTRMMQDKFHSLPYFALGHSMGSLILRTILGKYSDIYDGVLLFGTISIDFGTDACLAMIEAAESVKGSHFRSKALNKLLFGMSNLKIDKTETEYDWISTDSSVARSFAENPKCTFIFTAQAMYDLVMMVKYVSTKEWAEKVRTDLPILISGGAYDPVGHYGKFPREVSARLIKAGVKNVELKIYDGMRHEILNEVDKMEVYKDTLDWLDEHIVNI